MQTTPLLAASTMLDLPVVVTPVAVINGLPQAVHIAAPPWREDIALAAAHDIEQRLGILTPINPTQQHNPMAPDLADDRRIGA